MRFGNSVVILFVRVCKTGPLSPLPLRVLATGQAINQHLYNDITRLLGSVLGEGKSCGRTTCDSFTTETCLFSKTMS